MTSNQAENKDIMLAFGSTFIPLKVSSPVINPAIPHVGKIPGGLNQDKAVVFQGTVSATETGFTINFKTGPLSSDDITFNYTAYIGKYTSMNSCRSGNWESEYKIQGTPFTTGGNFIIIVAVNSVAYEVSVNGIVQCFFIHRFPLDKVSTINVFGNGSLQVLGFIDNWSTTSSFRELKTPQSTQSSTPSFTLSPSEISNQVIYPAIPHVITVPEGIHKGKAIFLQGRIPADSTSFYINFKTGPSGGHDIAFHYNPRVGSFTALNSCRNGTWEKQETAPDKPFNTGEAFQMIFVPNSESFEVYVNGSKHCVFKHRIPIEKVSTLDIQGNISQLICGFINNWCTSSCCLELQTLLIKEIIYTISKSITFQITNVVTNPEIPYVGKIPGGLKKDMAVVFHGSVLKDATVFSINFKTGPSDYDDNAFHFVPRIGNIIALNSFQNGNWGRQESISINPFTQGQDFQLILLINADGYQVYVNGKSLSTFKHRIQIEKVSTIYLNRDTTIRLIGFVENWKAT